MASASRQFCQCLKTASRITPAKGKSVRLAFNQTRNDVRHFSSSSSPWVDGPAARISQSRPRKTTGNDEDVLQLPEVDPKDYRTPSSPAKPADLDPEERANYETLSKEEQVKFLGLQNHYQAMLEDGDAVLDSEDVQRQIDQVDRESEIAYPFAFNLNSVVKDRELGYWGEEEEDELARTVDDDDTWDESMITSVAESQLEVHREVREYTRVAAWEMPLLHSTSYNTFSSTLVD